MAYLRDRLIQAAVTMYGVVTLSFIFTKMMPGGPVQHLKRQMRLYPSKYALPPNPSNDLIMRRVNKYVNLQPEEPLVEEYFDYMYQVFVEFDFGTSVLVRGGQPVGEIMLEAMPWTIFLSSIGLVYGLVVGIALGSLMAYYEGTKFDVGMTVTMILDGAVPYYAAAIILLFLLGFQWDMFPQSGRMNYNTTPGLNWPFIAGVLNHAALPAFSILLTGFGGNALGLRANAIRLIGSDHLRVAELRGLSNTRIATAYLARNAILPMYTSIVIGLGALLGGSVILEEIFNYRGMGLIMFEAIESKDMPVLMGGLVITTGLFVLGTLIADLTYSIVDPRADLREME